MQNERLQKLLDIQKEEPEDVFTNYAIAMEYKAMNQPEEAIRQFEYVLQLNAGEIPAYYQLGTLLYQQKKETEAIACIEKGIVLARSKGLQKYINEFRTLLDEWSF